MSRRPCWSRSSSARSALHRSSGPVRGWPSGSPDPRIWLATWIFSGAAVVILFGPFVAVRSFLPIHPPLVIWLLGSREPARPGRLALGLTVTLTLVLSTLLAAADFRWAACYPEAAAGSPRGSEVRAGRSTSSATGAGNTTRPAKGSGRGTPARLRPSRLDRARPAPGRQAVDTPGRHGPIPPRRSDRDPPGPLA